MGWHATGRRTRLGASVHYNQENYLQQASQDRESHRLWKSMSPATWDHV